MKPASGAYHALGGEIFSIDPCAVTYTVTTSDNSLFTIIDDVGIIGQKWIDDDTTIVGSDVSQYTGWGVTTTYTN